MKTLSTTLLVLVVVYSGIAQNRFWIASTSGNWNDPSNWSTTSGGAGGASVPTTTNVAIFNASGLGTCNLDIAPTVGGITMNGFTGIVDLQGSILTTTGVNTFASGIIQNSGAAASLDINSAGLTTFSGTAFNVPVTGSSGRVLFNGSVFNQPVSIQKSGATNDSGTGANTFNNTVTIGCSGSGQLQMATVSPDIFNGDLTINSDGTSAIQIARNALGTQFNENIIINYNSTGAVSLGNNGGTSTLASGKTLTVAGFGASGCGNLTLSGFTQLGSTSQNIALAGNNTATLTIGASSVFNGNLTVSSPSIILNSSTFEGSIQLTKTGTNTDNQRGGNLFNGTFTLNNQGGDFVLGSTTADAGDVWDGLATFNNSGGYRIRVGEETAGNLFNAPAVFNCLAATDVQDRIQISRLAGGETTFNSTATFNNNGTNSDIQISYDAGTVTIFNDDVFFNAATSGAADNYLAVDGAIQLNGDIIFTNTSTSSIYTASGAGSVTIGTGLVTIGGAGFSTGQLRLENFTQTGSTTQNITLTGTAIFRVGPGSTFEGDVNFVSPQIYLDGCTFNGTTYIEKNGASTNTCIGGNFFNGVTTLVNSGSGSWDFANTNPDVFDNTLTVNNTGTERIQLALNSAGNVFNGAVTFNHGGASATGNNFIVARNATSSATFNNTVNLNCSNTNTTSGIIIGLDGVVVINGNVVMTNSGRGIYFSSSSGSTTLSDGFTLSTGGAGTFTTGTLQLTRFTQLGLTPQTIALEGTASMIVGPSASFDADVDFRAPQYYLNGATYNGTTYIEKNGATSNAGNGGNNFNGATTLVNSGSGYLLTANTAPDVFNSSLDVHNTGTSIVYLAHNVAGTQFNGDVTFTSTGSSQGVWIGINATGTSTLGNGASLQVGAGGFSAGMLRIRRLTQIGSAAQTLLLTNTSLLELGPTTIFNGNVDFRSPQLELDGTTFNGTTYLEKSGATDNIGNGGNVFNGATTLVNSGSGYLLTANVTADEYNNTLDVINTGSNIIYLAHNVSGTVFKGDVSFTSTGSSQGIRLGTNTNGTSTIDNGVSLLVGSGGFTSGILRLRRLTQIGADDQTLLLTGTALMELGPSTTFNGNVDFRAPQFELDGTTFNGTTYIEKTGATTNDSNGGNIFNGVTTIVNSGSNYFRFAQTTLDTFNGDLTLSSTGSSTLRLADGVPGTVFNGNIQVNSINSSGGIYFGDQAGGGATLASGKTITVGASGFSVGDLRLKRFVQTGATAQALNLTGTANLVIGPTSTFNGDVDFRSPRIYLDGGTFNGTTFLQKNGITDDTGPGNNVFNGVTTLENTNANYFMTGNTTRDIFNGTLTLNNTSSGSVRLANNSAGNEFNANVLVNSSGSGFIIIGNAGGSSTLASGQTITVGAGGFTLGELRIRRMTQVGATPQSITLTGTGILRVGPGVVFDGEVNFVSPQLYLDGATYNSNGYFEKNGATNNDHVGGNIFAGTTTIVNSSTARMRMAGTSGDTFSGDVIFVKSSTGAFELAYNLDSFFAGNVTLNSNAALTFGAGTGVVHFSGSNNQTFGKTVGTPSPTFRRLTMGKSAGTVSFATDVTVSVSATFTSGVLETTATNFLNFADNATVSGASDLSYIDGPVRKTGNEAFTFPTGDGGFYRSIGISAPTGTAHFFTAQYFRSAHPYGDVSTWDPSFLTLSGCEYWILDRNAGTSSNVSVTLSWNESACEPGYITDPATLRVTRWNGTNWVDQGNGGTTGSATNGTITTAGAVTSFSPFSLASTSLVNPLPIELIDFRADYNYGSVSLHWRTASELNNEKFTVQRSSNGISFNDIHELPGAGTTNEESRYQYVDEAPLAGLSYYRLKQTDFDGTVTYPGIVSMRTPDSPIKVHPNPVGNEVIHFNKEVSIVIFNSMEYIVGEAFDVVEFDMKSLPSGFYVIKTSAGETVKIIKK